MKKIGIVIAMGAELDKVFLKLGKAQKNEKIGGLIVYTVTRGNAEIYIALSGVGEIFAAAATELLITKYQVETMLNFGFVGALNNSLKQLQTVAVKEVVHYEMDTSALDALPVGRYAFLPATEIVLDENLITLALKAQPNLKLVKDASGNKFIGKAEDKKYLVNTFGADICEMELAAISLVCKINDIPLLSLKVISDNADETGAKAFSEIAAQGSENCAEVFASVIDHLTK